MIEYQEPHSNKNRFIKIIAWIVIFVFTWNQIDYSADLFSFRPTLSPVMEKTLKGGGLTKGDGFTSNEEIEITNYDLFYYKNRSNMARKLLPTAKEQEESGTFSPNYLKRQQNKHEDVIRQKEAIDDLLESLTSRKPREDVELPLKKKKGGEEEQAAPYDYTLTDPYEHNPHNINIPQNPADWNVIFKYDITMMNIGQWMAGTQQETDDDGVTYWLGRGGGTPEEERLIMKVFYSGSGSNRKIDKIYLGFGLTETGEYEHKYEIEYTYSGNDLTETRKYDVSGDEKRLIEKSFYEGTGDDNRIKKTLYYGIDGSITHRRDFVYDAEGALKEALLYETGSEVEGEGKLIQRTVFVGEKNKEVADYSQNYYEGEVTDTTVYYYKDGKRASEVSGQEYRYSKSKQITF